MFFICTQDNDVSDERRKIANNQTDEDDVIVLNNLKKVNFQCVLYIITIS